MILIFFPSKLKKISSARIFNKKHLVPLKNRIFNIFLKILNKEYISKHNRNFNFLLNTSKTLNDYKILLK